MKKHTLLFLACTFSFIVSVGFKAIQQSQQIFAAASLPSAANDTTRILTDTLQTPISECEVVYQNLQLKNLGLSPEAFRYSWQGFERGSFTKPVIAIVDFSQSSRHKRLYVIDLKAQKLLYHTYVSHGRNSGEEYAKAFSNRESSYQSSLGFYRTLGTYRGKHGLSLKLQGLEEGINHRAMERAIVMHGADYVSERFIHTTGRLGRSQGCPAVSVQDAPKVINLLVNGAGLFLYYPDPTYFKRTKFVVPS